MSEAVPVVSSNAELVKAVEAADVTKIEVRGRLEDVPTIRLTPGQTLAGAAGAFLRFTQGADGLVLTADNTVENLELHTDAERCAIRNDTTTAGFGRLALHHLRTTGCVRLLAEGAATGGHVNVRDLHVVEADARAFEKRASAFGVEVISGAFTLWNRQQARESRVSAELRGVTVGRAGAPVHGTGVLVGGTLDGGSTVVNLLETGEVYSNGGIAPGTPDKISGGVFVVQGAQVGEVRNLGAVTTFDPNDMVLDDWGTVERWHAHGNITSYGPSGIGFVNLGELGELTIDGVLETHGLGSCGFNSGEVKQGTADAPADPQAATAPVVYNGTVRQATFERVVTRGDGAIGIQVSVPIGSVHIRKGIETFGGVGASLARGVVTKLAAVAFSLKPSGSARELVIGGGLSTHGKGIEAIELHGQIDTVRITGAIGPIGGGFAVV